MIIFRCKNHTFIHVCVFISEYILYSFMEIRFFANHIHTLAAADLYLYLPETLWIVIWFSLRYTEPGICMHLLGNVKTQGREKKVYGRTKVGLIGVFKLCSKDLESTRGATWKFNKLHNNKNKTLYIKWDFADTLNYYYNTAIPTQVIHAQCLYTCIQIN